MRKCGCIRAKVVVFEQKRLYSGKVIVIRQRGCIWAKVVVIWQSGCNLAERCCNREEVVVFGQGGCL